MKMVYANESHFLVNNVKQQLEEQGLDVFVKNEYAQGAMGEISPFDSWPEVWVVNDNDHQLASEIIKSLDKRKENDWFCSNCAEKNDGSFEVCWSCQHDGP